MGHLIVTKLSVPFSQTPHYVIFVIIITKRVILFYIEFHRFIPRQKRSGIIHRPALINALKLQLLAASVICVLLIRKYSYSSVSIVAEDAAELPVIGRLFVIEVQRVDDALLNARVLGTLALEATLVLSLALGDVWSGGIARVHGLGVHESRASPLRIMNLVVLKSNGLSVEKFLNDIVGPLLLTCLQEPVGLQNLGAGVIVLGVHDDLQSGRAMTLDAVVAMLGWGAAVLDSPGGTLGISVDSIWIGILWQLIVWLSELLLAVGIGAILVELTLAILDPELAELGLIVVVLNIHHFENELCWEWLY